MFLTKCVLLATTQTLVDSSCASRTTSDKACLKPVSSSAAKALMTNASDGMKGQKNVPPIHPCNGVFESGWKPTRHQPNYHCKRSPCMVSTEQSDGPRHSVHHPSYSPVPHVLQDHHLDRSWFTMQPRYDRRLRETGLALRLTKKCLCKHGHAGEGDPANRQAIAIAA